ncbi:MAG TPA: hypothetical protein VNN10_07635 [Dehalococcoidia bacterium]|nr:hypothetical protein [Dehalococcoidia bacterium]
MLLARTAYRARQFLLALFPRFEEHHGDLVRSVLNEGELALFESMEVRDQRHGIRVMEHLLRDHHADRDLLAAGLLHDCGKGRVPLWLRVAYVAAPWLVRLLARGAEPSGAPRARAAAAAAYRLVHHASLGAALAARAGSSEATVRYISGSVPEHEHDKIAVLRAADDRS